MICSYCNGQNGPGSRYKTQYVVGILAETYCIGYAMQPVPGKWVWEKEEGESREREKASAKPSGKQLLLWGWKYLSG